jgi:hypothetical protein
VVGGECVVNGTLNSQPWPRLWHNLRASAQTNLANLFPAHVVCEWLGNTAAVARDHYLQVTEAHFDLARQWAGPLGAVPPTRSASCLHAPILSGGTEGGTQAVQFAAQQNYGSTVCYLAH